MAICYILFSSSLNKFYIGHTESSMEERLHKHLTNHSGFTSRAKDWEVVFKENFETKSEACRRELQIKSWKSLKRITEFISRQSSTGSEHSDL